MKTRSKVFSLTAYHFFSLFVVNFLDGKFGAMMQVHIQNDGPVTLEIESPNPKDTTET